MSSTCLEEKILAKTFFYKYVKVHTPIPIVYRVLRCEPLHIYKEMFLLIFFLLNTSNSFVYILVVNCKFFQITPAGYLKNLHPSIAI